MKTFGVRLVSVVLIVAMLVGYNSVVAAREKEDEAARLTAEEELARWYEENAELLASLEQEEATGAYADGIYTGEALGFGGTVAVAVTIESGYITDITITSAENEDGAYLTMAEDIIPKIIEAQSSDVDTISGATFSSTGIKDAVAMALEGAVN